MWDDWLNHFDENLCCRAVINTDISLKPAFTDFSRRCWGIIWHDCRRSIMVQPSEWVCRGFLDARAQPSHLPRGWGCRQGSYRVSQPFREWKRCPTTNLEHERYRTYLRAKFIATIDWAGKEDTMNEIPAKLLTKKKRGREES